MLRFGLVVMTGCVILNACGDEGDSSNGKSEWEARCAAACTVNAGKSSPCADEDQTACVETCVSTAEDLSENCATCVVTNSAWTYHTCECSETECIECFVDHKEVACKGNATCEPIRECTGYLMGAPEDPESACAAKYCTAER